MKLVILGDGELKEEIEALIEQKGMKPYIIMLGNKSNVEDYYQAFDVFLLPSHYEGFPMVVVEAMASGLPIVLSDTITRELSFGKDVYYLPLKQEEKWINILYQSTMFSEDMRLKRQQYNLHYEIDIHNTLTTLENIYDLR